MLEKLAIGIIKFYSKGISPSLVLIFGYGCRFEPTCSVYTIKSIEKYGITKGAYLGIKRFLKCNPLSQSATKALNT